MAVMFLTEKREVSQLSVCRFYVLSSLSLSSLSGAVNGSQGTAARRGT